MNTRFTAFAALVLAATAFFAFRPAETGVNDAETATLESMIPASWADFGFSNEVLEMAPPCSPRAIIGSDPLLKDCLRAAFERGCDLDINATVLGTCPDGQFNVQIDLSKPCTNTLGAVTVTPVANVFVCGCDLDSWVCL
jgi:hypothetical protein